MQIKEILQACAEQSVHLEVVEGQLDVMFDDFPSEDLIEQLKANKQALIDFLEQQDSGPKASPITRLNKLSGPLSFTQNRLWFVDQLEAESHQYNMPLTLELKGNLNVDLLNRTLATIIQRHQPLRTIYGKSEQRQYVQESIDFQLQHLDLSQNACDITSLRVREAIEEEACKPFNLSQDVMLRALLIKLGEQHHVVQLTIHHIACDGWSIGLFIREFVELYQSGIEQRAPTLTELPIEYLDYAYWLHENREHLDHQVHYWLKKLADLPPLHGLPTDYSRPQEQSFSGESLSVEVSADSLQSLKQVCQQQDTTLFMLLHSVFSLLISRWSGEQDIAIGTPVAGRSQRELEALIGFFANTLVLRSDVENHLTFSQFLQNNKSTVLDAFSNQDVPFEVLVDKLQPERSLAHSPLFQILLTLHSQESADIKLPSVEVNNISSEINNAKFDLELAAKESNGQLTLEWRFVKALFARSTIERFAKSFTFLLEQVCHNIEQPLSDFELLPGQEFASIIEWEAGEEVVQNSGKTLLYVFDRQVQQNPDRVALIYGESSLSYKELDERSNQMAHHLAQCQLGEEAIVGISIPRSLEMVVAILGVLKSGAAYLPLEIGYPEARLDAMRKDSGAAVILTQEDCTFDALASFDKSYISQSTCVPDSLAYVIYTSGSTGVPKGVSISHQNVMTFLQAMAFAFDDSTVGKWLAVTGISFDISVLEILGTLCYGFSTVIANDQKLSALSAQESSQLSSYLSIAEQIDLHHISHIQCTPSFALMQLVQQAKPDQLRSLKKIFLGGEALPHNLVQTLAETTQAEIFNMYGPTEATVWSTCDKVDPGSDSIHIGNPINNYRTYVLDEKRRRVPIGAKGQLFIAGSAISRGYLNRTELSQEKFVEDIHSASERMYATGDLALWTSTGKLKFLGRMDSQIKLRGFRIELGEIEAVLSQVKGVDLAAVVLHKRTADDASLVAYVQSDLDSKDLVVDMKAHLASSLPEHMIPTFFEVMTTLPQTLNGKIDRKALPEPKVSVNAEDIEAPVSDTETQLIKIWSELLQVDLSSISRHANFFALGGHSLLLTRLLMEVNTRFRVALTLKEVFERPVLCQQAEHIDVKRQEVDASHFSIEARGEKEGALSYSQMRLWFIDNLQQGTPEYNIAAAFKVEGTFEPELAETAINQIIQRHEILRTQYFDENGVAVQRVSSDFHFTLAVHDLRNVNEETQQQQVYQLIDEDNHHPFNLQQDLAIRASYIRIGTTNSHNEGILLFNMHHIASDGWSFGVLVKEFVAYYEALKQGKSFSLPPLPIQYLDYAHWQREWLSGEALEQQLSYWESQLENAPVVHSLPLCAPRPQQKSHSGKMISGRLSLELSQQLQQLAAQHQVSLFVLLHAVLGLVLSRHGNNHDWVIGTPIANRAQSELESLIGFFVNTLVLRTSTDHKDFGDYLAHVKQVNLDAQANQDVPFELLVERCQVTRSTQHSPLFQIMLTMNIGDSAPLALDGLSFSQMPYAAVVAKFDLELIAQETEQGLFLAWVYDDSIFSEPMIRRMQAHFEGLLAHVVTLPDTAMPHWPMLSNEEQKYLLEELQPASGEMLPYEVIHQGLEEQAAQQPDAVAVIYGEDHLTYQALNTRANQLAHYLREQKSIETGARVGISMSRSLDMVIAVLATLKAGCVYVPLDPKYPAERLSFLAEDAGLALLITDRSVAKSWNDVAIETLVLDALSAVLAEQSDKNLPIDELELEGDGLAYVIYTSGSTGQPKGVEIRHRNTLALLSWAKASYSADILARVLASTSLNFDLSVFELFVPLSLGHQCVLVDDALSLLDDSVAVTLINTVPSAIKSLLDADAIPPGVKAINLAGEALSAELVNGLLDAGTCEQVINLYGPTEDTTYSTYAVFAECLEDVPVIGQVVSHSQGYVLGNHQELLPFGSVGELYLGGAGVAAGYRNRDELTAERFIENPFGAGRLYRTGDVVRYLPNGALAYLGREDDQVKVRGFRIELGEVQHQVLQQPGVKSAVVLAEGAGSGDKVLRAYVVLEDGVDSDSALAQLKSGLEQCLPDYMMPSVFVLLSAFPLTANGKVDKRALSRLESGASEASYVAPSGYWEEGLARLWSVLLKRELSSISALSNFFELGGHSLLAVRLVSEMRAELGVESHVKAVFESPMLKDLAQRVSLLESGRVRPAVTALRDEERDFVCSFAQQRLWFIDQLEGGSPEYNMPIALRVEGSFDVEIAEQALQ
ncbi:non-ribosomal peptide synthetase, partial [Pleionea sp. CnH1-48]|uniref:non-ribosomal peptide synthetase n=1 Tax=Pleionea sp. CnH1-48 TaxID=2954494 RepID=UPI002097CD3D